MFKRFLKYYLLMISCIFILVLSIDYAFIHYQKKNAPIEIELNNVVTLLKEYCEKHTCSLKKPLPFSEVKLVSQKNLGISDKSLHRIESGEILSVVGQANQFFHYVKIDKEMYARIDTVITLQAPFFKWYTTGFYLLLGAIIFGILYPLFRDMFNLKTAASNFARNRKLDQLELPKSIYFQPVNDAFKWMITKIARLIALQKELSDTLSHELRTSISRLSFSLATLEQSNVEEMKSLLQQDIDELKVLVEEYLSFSQQEHETPTLNIKNQSLVPTIEHYINLLGQYSSKQISFIYKESLDIPFDQRAMARAVKNLIDNAIKYSTNNINITLFVERKHLVFQVDDDGKGINTTEIDELFLPYTRSTNTKEISGYGLGLAITRKIVDWHHGELIAKKSTLLSGACFQLKLPLAKTLELI